MTLTLVFNIFPVYSIAFNQTPFWSNMSQIGAKGENICSRQGYFFFIYNPFLYIILLFPSLLWVLGQTIDM